MRELLNGVILVLCAIQLLAGCTKSDKKKMLGPPPGYMEVHGLLEDGGTISSNLASAHLSISQALNANEKDFFSFGVGFSEYEPTGTTETITVPGSQEPIIQEKIIKTSAGFSLFFEVTPTESINNIINGKHVLPDRRFLPGTGKIKRYEGRANGLTVTLGGEAKDYFSIGGYIDVTYDEGNLEGTFEVDVVTAKGTGFSEAQTITGKFSSNSVNVRCEVLETASDVANSNKRSGTATTDGSPQEPGLKSARFSHEFCKQYF